MKAAVLTAFCNDFEIKELPIPVYGADEVLVQVKACGLCGTDLHIRAGMIPTVKLPRIQGHEAAGIIVGMGSNVTDLCIGDHIVVSIDRICGHCRYCRNGKENLCRNLIRNGFEHDGGFAEYMVIPKTCAFRIDKNIPFEEAAIIPDAVACMVHAVYGQAKVKKDDRVCILGMGGLGFQAIQILKHIGAEIYCTSRQDVKLEMSAEYGAAGCINTKKDFLKERIYSLTEGEMCDVVLDNIGNETSIQDALDILAPGGKVIIVGYAAERFYGNYQNTMMCEKEILGMRGSTRNDLKKAIELVERGVIKPYVHTKLEFEHINEAVKLLADGKALGRIVLTM